VSSELAAAATPSAAESQYAAAPGLITRWRLGPFVTQATRDVSIAIALTCSHRLIPRHVQADSGPDGQVGHMVPATRPDGPGWGLGHADL